MIGKLKNEDDIRKELNRRIEILEQLDKEIDVLILRRNLLFKQVETGIALLERYKDGK